MTTLEPRCASPRPPEAFSDGGSENRTVAWFESRLAAVDSEQWEDGATLQGLVRTTGIDELPQLLEAVVGLADASRANQVLEEAWRAQPMAMVVLAAFLQVAPKLPIDALADWSGRLRVRGCAPLCPLMARATDRARPVTERLEAARRAWDRFFDPDAGALLQQLGDLPPASVPGYYLHTRPEVVAQVPVGARRVLDVGCAAGRVGASIKYRQPATVCGVEVEPEAARHAEQVLDEVCSHDLDAGALDRLDGPFDAVVAADVLEHLRDPWKVVAELRDKLRPGGVLVASLPNIANLGVISALVAGRFDYQDAGILDRTHLRFFTKGTAAEMLRGAGLEIESVIDVHDPAIPWVAAPPPGTAVDLNVGQLGLKQVDGARIQELSSVQFVFTARKRAPAGSTVASAVWDCVLFYNELEMLEARLEELRGITDHLVVVESPQTFRGDAKPLHFAENRARFERFGVGLHHVVVQFDAAQTAWQREKAQRDAILQAVSGARPDDLLLLCDADEIVGREAIPSILAATETGPVSLEMALYYYSMRWRSPQRWVLPKALRARDLPASVDALRGAHAVPVVPGSGWHLSYFGGDEQIHHKLRAYSHSEYDTPAVHGAVPDLVRQGLTVHGIKLERAEDAFPAHLSERFPLDDGDAAATSVASRPAPQVRPQHRGPEPRFVENWYPEGQLRDLVRLADEARGIPGELVEIGCWEGRSTVALARACEGWGRRLHAVDWWLGNTDEGEAHPSVTAARQRDVYQTFLDNVAPYPHVLVHRQEGAEFLRTLGRPIAFIHLDAGHTYAATKTLIDLALPLLAPGGIICGDDYQNSHIGRHDLGGGVEGAVRDALHGEAEALGNLWLYRRPLTPPVS